MLEATLATATIIPIRPRETAEEPANDAGKVFDAEVAAVLATGTLLASYERISAAALDPRLERAHCAVLTVLTRYINHEDGTAYPSRETIAEQTGLSTKTVGNSLYELRRCGYVTWQLQRSKRSARKLVHYTLALASKPNSVLQLEVISARAGAEAALPRPRGKSSAPPTGHAPPTGQISAPSGGNSNLSTEHTKIQRAKGDASPRRGTRFPEEMTEIPEAWLAWALSKFHCSADEVHWRFEEFYDYWKGATKNSTKLDWFATFRNACRQRSNWKRRTKASAQSRALPTEAAADDLDRQYELARREDGS